MFESLVIPKELYPSDPRFGVGPSLIPKNHLDNLAKEWQSTLGRSHRKPIVKDICKEIQLGLAKYFNLPKDYEVLLGNGGATFLFDMIGLGLVEKQSLHFVSGEFSDKWYLSHKNIPHIEAHKVGVNFGEGINPKFDKNYDMICCTLNETSTGVMLSELCDVDEKTLLAVDATSGAGQIKLDFSKVDLYFFSPQKVFASEGGLYIAILSPKAIKRAEDLSQRNTYTPEVMKWQHALTNSRAHQTYNTPSVSTLFLLNEQIKAMNELGEDKVIEFAKYKANFLYKWAQSKSYLSCFIKEEQFRSISVATIDIDKSINADDLENKLSELGIIFDINGYRKLNRNQIRISLFHNITLDNIIKLTEVISYAIESELKEF